MKGLMVSGRDTGIIKEANGSMFSPPVPCLQQKAGKTSSALLFLSVGQHPHTSPEG